MLNIVKQYNTQRALLVILWSPMLIIGLAGCGDSQQAPPATPTTVVVSEVKEADVPIVMQVAGTVQPKKTVRIIPRVSGYIFERNFVEGSFVKQGDSLYVIDPRPYKATLDAHRAQLEQHRANYKFWTGEAVRYTRLAKQGAGSVEDKEKALARKAEMKAAIDADKAQVENAELNLAFTHIKAPFDGRIENTLAHVGDLVHQQQTELTTVVLIDPIYVISNVSRAQVYQVQELQKKSLAPTDLADFKADLIMPDGKHYMHQGSLNFMSNLINAATDTVQVRYEFPNPKTGEQRALIPGQYIPLRMIVGHQPGALLFPERALLQSQEGTHVLVVSDDNKVEKRMVTIGDSHEQQWISTSGLKAGEKIIVEGLQKVRSGQTVTVTDVASHRATLAKQTVTKHSKSEPEAE